MAGVYGNKCTYSSDLVITLMGVVPIQNGSINYNCCSEKKR